MSQQERYEGSPLPDKDLAIRIAEPLRFADLGITNTREGLQTLGLDFAPVTNVKIDDPNSNSSTYLSLMDKQIRGYVFGKILNGVAPFGQANAYGIEADLEMPKRAISSTRFKTDTPRLHSVHQSDPTIGSLYEQYVKSHNDQWLKALKSGRFDSFDSFLKFVDSEELGLRSFRQIQENLEVPSFYKNGSEWNRIGRALSYYPGIKDKFIQYLSTQRPFKKIFGDDNKTHRFFSMPLGRKVKILRQYVDQLEENDQREFALRYIGDTSSLLIDPQKEKVWKANSPSLDNISISFIDNAHILVQNRGDKAIVTLRSSAQDDGSKEWNIEHIELSDSPDALYSLMAWEKDKSGKRRFLSQDEALALYPKELPHKDQADVFVGRVLAGSFSPLVTKTWAREIALVHGQRLQRMMGGQMSLWVSLDTKELPHATGLLNSQDSVVPKLEAHIDRNPA